MSFDASEHPHRRQNLLTGDWLLVSPHRAKRPWQGDATPPDDTPRPGYDPGCYLCPGNVRANGVRNPDYADTFVFANDFAALLPETPTPPDDPLFPAGSASGEARVICFSPDHGKTLPALDEAEMRAVVETWCAQSAELGSRWAHVQLFENKGAMMGCSSPHPHGQVWAGDFVPTEVAKEDAAQHAWFAEHREPLLAQVAAREAALGTRVIEDDAHWLAIVPWWAAWPYETLLIARDPVARIEELSDAARAALGRMMTRLTARYDDLFQTSFPYSMGWHGAPHGAADTTGWRLHAHFYPPLLRSASVRKFMVGYEMMAEAQRDLTPEQAADHLRAANPEYPW